MRILALIPDEYLREAEAGPGFRFHPVCTIGRDGEGNVALFIRVEDQQGNALNGTQFIADLSAETT